MLTFIEIGIHDINKNNGFPKDLAIRNDGCPSCPLL